MVEFRPHELTGSPSRMKTRTEPPPELAPLDTITTEEILELPAEPPLDPPPPELPLTEPKPPEPFLRRG